MRAKDIGQAGEFGEIESFTTPTGVDAQIDHDPFQAVKPQSGGHQGVAQGFPALRESPLDHPAKKSFVTHRHASLRQGIEAEHLV